MTELRFVLMCAFVILSCRNASAGLHSNVVTLPEATLAPKFSEADFDYQSVSPIRTQGETFAHAALRSMNVGPHVYDEQSDDVFSTRGSLESLQPDATPMWEDSVALNRIFLDLRDKRFLQDPTHSDFSRRISWLYPDDGCFIRAELLSEKLQELGYGAPVKIFAFGDLSVTTRYSPRGQVNWWYHVAVGYRIDDVVFVLDPSVDWRGPMSLQDWLEKIHGNTESTKINICDAAAIGPRSKCHESVVTPANEVAIRANKYLDAEWMRIDELSLKPSDLLGEAPPWMEL